MGIFDISISGLLTNQASIATTSHNIANANVEGYSRQRIDQSARTPEFIGGNFFGTGVEVGNVRRIFEATQQLELQAATADFNNFESFLNQAQRVDGLLADSDNGINNAIQKFYTALQGVVNDPASVPARQVMLSEAETMASRFEQVHSQLENQISEINGSIDSIASEISALADSIAKLNNQIAGSPGSAPPDLLDRRDREITRLSELIGVQTLEQDDGSLNVFIGTGQSLVVGSLSNTLSATVDPLDPRSMQLSITAGSSAIDITNNLTGGELGGLLDVVDDVIEPAFNTLGRVAIGISNSFNNQHQLGLDLNNQLGGAFFTDMNSASIEASRVIASTSNTGNATLSITIDDPSLLTDSNYQLRLIGGNYQLFDLSNNATIATFAPPGVVPDTVQVAAEGFTINFLSGAANNGDAFEFQNTRNFARDIDVLVTTPEQIAAASPIRGEQASTNIGSGSITALTVTDTSTAQFTTTPGNLAPPIRIEFDATPGEFSLYDMTTGVPVLLVGGVTGFVPNQENNMLALAGAPYNAYGYEVTISGDPQAGDDFDISYNANGAGNNSNISLLGELQFANTLDNGNSNFQQAFGRIISSVGVNTQAAEIKRDAAESLLFQANERKQSTSGVNLDEEAANLIKFQQAYEASAQVISVARTLFQTVLDSVR
ncbi:flagellar hook-associated protein FlgK [Aliikangiella coralliicola]|uniref:Flagellar hook-associated protein 1 n=1 Tax=Aliikangiella coralliicola TaxID=2592383 RepID=A0A545U5W6_9GAMM|nr:flagellar hook-associated protein FlgK [Aliikangiella coralliicola]TQV84865.1 flagellar hook-associated protein FlgK [Aliikangiella coralliicola]